jgi:uncharacterized membrane-anchored protein YhcB (DUF1043 family)
MQNRFKDWVIPTIIGVTSFVAGVGSGIGIGYVIARRKMKEIPEEVNEKLEEIESEQLQFKFERNERDREFNFQIQQAASVARDLKETGRDFLQRYAAMALDAEVVEKKPDPNPNGSGTIVAIQHHDIEGPLVTSVFNEEDDGWDYEVEVPLRTKEKPYIIHRDEFFSNEEDYTQDSLTWYEGDEILVDDHDTPVYNAESIVGTLKFGHGSGDSGICYVRNDKLESEFEIILDHGYYQTEVLGQQIEHSRKGKKQPKFKLE